MNFLERGQLLGIIGGLIVFLVILSFIIYYHSDFDSQLIDQVASNVPAEKLIQQIDNQTQNYQLKAKQRYESNVLSKKNWGNGSLDSPKNYQYYTQGYESDLKMIDKLDNIRKKFANHEINKEEFLKEIKETKDYFSFYF